jgi:hypothetical protein
VSISFEKEILAEEKNKEHLPKTQSQDEETTDFSFVSIQNS